MQSDKHDNLMPVRQRAARSWVAQPSAGVPTGRTPIANALRARVACEPDRYSTSVALATPGQLFIDYLHHGRGTVAIGANSRRARTRCRTH